MRLIDADALLKYLMINMSWHDEDGIEVDDWDEKRAIIKDLIDGVPTVDAVPVVRCKDCRYWRQEVSPTEHWVCAHHSFNERKMYTMPDFYCADGEKVSE